MWERNSKSQSWKIHSSRSPTRHASRQPFSIVHLPQRPNGALTKLVFFSQTLTGLSRILQALKCGNVPGAPGNSLIKKAFVELDLRGPWEWVMSFRKYIRKLRQVKQYILYVRQYWCSAIKPAQALPSKIVYSTSLAEQWRSCSSLANVVACSSTMAYYRKTWIIVCSVEWIIGIIGKTIKMRNEGGQSKLSIYEYLWSAWKAGVLYADIGRIFSR